MPAGSDTATTATTATTTSTTTSSSSASSTGTPSTTETTEGGTTTGTTSIGGTETDGTESDGCVILGCNDPSTAWCDIWSQDCPEGYKCTPWASDGGSSWDVHACAPLDPEPVGPGEVCTAKEIGYSGIDNCDAQSICWHVDSRTLEGVCIALCEGNSEEDATCEPGFSCTYYSLAVLFLCFPACDPLLQDCPGDQLCIPTGQSFTCDHDASGEAGLNGDPCEHANACKPGLYCLSAEYTEGCQAAGCCTPFCDTSKPLMCPGATQECIPWYGDAPEGYEHVGICGIPQ